MEARSDKIIDCIVCKEKIHQYAIKCVHCGSFQNWRRHLNLSSTFLSIMLAFVSVLTVFFSVALDSVNKNNSDLKVSIINWQRQITSRGDQVLVVEAIVTNTGKKPGVIKTFSIKGSGEKEFHHMRIGLPNFNKNIAITLSPQIIEPGKTIILTKHLINERLGAKSFEKLYANTDLLVELINFNGKSQKIVIEIRDTPPKWYM
jgi:hypothetical protein